MNSTKLERLQCAKDLNITVASSLKFSQQCKDAAGKANRMLDKQKFLVSRQRRNSIFVYQISQIPSGVRRAILSPRHAKDTAKLEAF